MAAPLTRVRTPQPASAPSAQIGIFSIALWPYSFKLGWAPVVDSIWSAAFGRRKSWVVRAGPTVLRACCCTQVCVSVAGPTWHLLPVARGTAPAQLEKHAGGTEVPRPALRAPRVTTALHAWPQPGRCPQVPIQLLSAAVMLGFASWAEARLESADVASITALFALLVLLAATQVSCHALAPDPWRARAALHWLRLEGLR